MLRVERAVVELDRAGDPRRQVEHVLDAAAVVGHRGIDAGRGRGHVGQAPAHAVAEGADTAALHLGPGPQGLRRISQVTLQRGAVGGHRHGTTALDVLGRVADIQAMLLLPEHVGRQHDEAVQRVLLGHRADVLD